MDEDYELGPGQSFLGEHVFRLTPVIVCVCGFAWERAPRFALVEGEGLWWYCECDARIHLSRRRMTARQRATFMKASVLN